jgi:hypothetical protein
VPKLTLKAALSATPTCPATSAAWATRATSTTTWALSYDFGNGLSLTGSVQGANKKANYQVVANPGIDIPDFGTFGTTYYSPNKARFILTLTKTL